MPTYLFRCDGCASESELLLPLGDVAPRTCPDCDGTMRQRFARVAVKYGAWGFTSTDSLSSRPGGTDFKRLAEKAEQISDS